MYPLPPFVHLTISVTYVVKILCACVHPCVCRYYCAYYTVVSVVVGWFSSAGVAPPYPHAVAVLPPLPQTHTLRSGKFESAPSLFLSSVHLHMLGFRLVYVLCFYPRTVIGLLFYLLYLLFSTR